MNEFLNKVAALFTPRRRKAIYHVASAVLLVLVVNKLITTDEAAGYVQAIGIALGFGTAQMAAANVKDDE